MKKFVTVLFYTFFAIGSVGLLVSLGGYFQQGSVSLHSDFNYERISSIGDFTGGLWGTLFNVAAILLIWLTYSNQKEELSETRKLVDYQLFDTTFFNLLSQLQNVTNNIDLRIMKYGKQLTKDSAPKLELDHVVTGKDCFHNLHETYKTHFRKKISKDDAIVKTFNDNSSDLGPWLQTICVLIKEVSTRSDDSQLLLKYSLIFKSSLSKLEVSFLRLMFDAGIVGEDVKKDAKIIGLFSKGHINTDLPKISDNPVI
jgi:hypothetical protein